jgi:hypothetical protein
MASRPLLFPSESWTPDEAASFIARYDADVTEAMTRLQERLLTEHPHGSIFVHRYTADAICRYNCTRRATAGQAMGYVEVRLRSGECYSGTVLVRWADGAVVIAENPAIPA